MLRFVRLDDERRLSLPPTHAPQRLSASTAATGRAGGDLTNQLAPDDFDCAHDDDLEIDTDDEADADNGGGVASGPRSGGDGGEAKEREYLLVATLMGAFDKERAAMEARCAELEALLRAATEDLEYLNNERDSDREDYQ